MWTDNLRKFHFWCQKVLPLVYDDSLSYYEVLAKLTKHLNELTDLVNEIGDELERYEGVTDNRLDNLETWRTEVDTWRAQIDTWQTQINTWKNSIDTWKSGIDTWRNSINTFVSSINDWKDNTVNPFITDVTSRLTDAENDISSLESRVDDAEDEISSHEIRIDNAEDDISTLETKVSDAESDIETLENNTINIGKVLTGILSWDATNHRYTADIRQDLSQLEFNNSDMSQDAMWVNYTFYLYTSRDALPLSIYPNITIYLRDRYGQNYYTYNGNPLYMDNFYNGTIQLPNESNAQNLAFVTIKLVYYASALHWSLSVDYEDGNGIIDTSSNHYLAFKVGDGLALDTTEIPPTLNSTVSNISEYSTTAQTVSKWIDGTDVYEKVFVFNGIGNVNSITLEALSVGVSGSVKDVISFSYFIKPNWSGATDISGCNGPADTTIIPAKIYRSPSNTTIQFSATLGTGPWTVYIIMRYTIN